MVRSLLLLLTLTACGSGIEVLNESQRAAVFGDKDSPQEGASGPEEGLADMRDVSKVVLQFPVPTLEQLQNDDSTRAKLSELLAAQGYTDDQVSGEPEIQVTDALGKVLEDVDMNHATFPVSFKAIIFVAARVDGDAGANDDSDDDDDDDDDGDDDGTEDDDDMSDAKTVLIRFPVVTLEELHDDHKMMSKLSEMLRARGYTDGQVDDEPDIQVIDSTGMILNDDKDMVRAKFPVTFKASVPVDTSPEDGDDDIDATET